MSQQVVSELAPHGVLRAAINMGNFLLVTGRTASGDPDGCSPDMARAIHQNLPGSELLIIPSAAHLSNVEQPQLFNNAMMGFLDRFQAQKP